MEPWTKVRSDIAITKRRDPNADVTELKRELAAAVAAEHIMRLVNEAPALTGAQIDRLATLLRGSVA